MRFDPGQVIALAEEYRLARGDRSKDLADRLAVAGWHVERLPARHRSLPLVLILPAIGWFWYGSGRVVLGGSVLARLGILGLVMASFGAALYLSFATDAPRRSGGGFATPARDRHVARRAASPGRLRHAAWGLRARLAEWERSLLLLVCLALGTSPFSCPRDDRLLVGNRRDCWPAQWSGLDARARLPMSFRRHRATT